MDRVTALSRRDQKLLWSRSRNRCAFPGCRQPLSAIEQDAQTGEGFHTIIGEEAHIHSETPDGPRYDPDYPEKKLKSSENRILLCSVHHTRIDAENGRGFDADTLRKMKKQHEEQEERRERLEATIQAYMAGRFADEDRVEFRQVRLEGPKVDDMFVDVPLAPAAGGPGRERLEGIVSLLDGGAEQGATLDVGAAQALLHPNWTGNALIVGGPGQGKSTLLQYICQFHRARRLSGTGYTGEAQDLNPVTDAPRVPIRIDLRRYAQWARAKGSRGKKRSKSEADEEMRPLELYITNEVRDGSGGHQFSKTDLVTLIGTEPVLLALDGLDEVADLQLRNIVGRQVLMTASRLQTAAADLMVVITSRPGVSTSPLWSSPDFPIFHLQKLTAPLRLLYLRRWCKVAALDGETAKRLENTFQGSVEQPHIRDLASYPMQLAILLHLLHRRGLLPQQRTELYAEYLKTFLDREQTGEKEPLLSTDREVIEDVHAYIGWKLQCDAEQGGGTGQISRDDLQRALWTCLADRAKGRELAEALFSAVEGRVLCLVERQQGYFQFEVQSLREYFAALYIYENSPPQGEGNSRVDCFEALLQRPYWLNVCRFFVGMFTKIEVRSIAGTLRKLQATPTSSLHPHLRLAATQFLEDRVYQSQGDQVILDMVRFVLDGPGMTLANDGAIDGSGSSLTFAEDAGRLQAVQVAEEAFARRDAGGPWRDAVAIAERHVEQHSGFERWWWKQFQPTLEWLDCAGDAGMLNDQSHRQQVIDCVTALHDDGFWVSHTLNAGHYDGTADEIFSICRDEINDGAIEGLPAHDESTIGRLAWSAETAIRPRSTAHSHRRTRFRGAAKDTLYASLVNGGEELHPGREVDTDGWADRLVTVARLWGDGWVVRQSIAWLPPTADMGAIVTRVGNQNDEVCCALTTEVERRAHRADSCWWQEAFEVAGSDFDRRDWLVAVLMTGQSQVLVDLANQLDDTVSTLTPEHYGFIYRALQKRASSTGRQVNLQQPIRRGQFTGSARLLWLLRSVVTDGSREQIDKKITPDVIQEAIKQRIFDLDALLHIAGQRKKLKIATLHGARELIQPFGSIQQANLGAMSTRLGSEILQCPHEWPRRIVELAIQQESAKLEELAPIGELAEVNRWFHDQ